jgi:hypothetical protein
MRNTGDTTWSASGLYRLGAQAPQDNSIWGLPRVELPNSVAPGETVTFNFTVSAPQVAGTYNFQWRMVQEFVEWFGDYTANVAVKDGENNAAFVSQNVPSVMIPRQTYPITVSFRNMGTTTWSPAAQYRLGTQNPQDNGIWGVQRVELPGPVAPGETATFTFEVTAPARVGAYNMQFRMVQEFVEWFGEYSPSISVTDGINAASFESQNVPVLMVPGQTYPVSVTMRNTGNTTWSAGDMYRLGAQNAQDNATWGVSRVELPSSVVPGQNVAFNFNVTAPAIPGSYNFQWQMVEDFVEWFGARTQNVVVRGGANDAAFVEQTVPPNMTAGQQYPVTITMANTGTTTWRAGTLFRLGSQNPQDNNTWTVQRVELPADVAPGANATFAFQVRAPSTPGAYDFQWRMVQEHVEWFGGFSANAPVVVAPAAAGTVELFVYGVGDGYVFYEGAGVSIEVEAVASEGAVTSTTLKVNGASVETIHTADHSLYQWTPLPLGTHVITAHAQSDRGASATSTMTIEVIVNPEDIPFRAVLNDFKTALAGANKPAAMALLTEQARHSYGPVLDVLMPFMSEIVSEWSEPRRLSGSESRADYAVVRTTGGVQGIYVFSFVRGEDGNWLIDSM